MPGDPRGLALRLCGPKRKRARKEGSAPWSEALPEGSLILTAASKAGQTLVVAVADAAVSFGGLGLAVAAAEAR